MNPHPFTPVSRFGVSPMPDAHRPVECIRDDGTVMVAMRIAGLWYADGKRLDTIANRIAFWRYVE